MIRLLLMILASLFLCSSVWATNEEIPPEVQELLSSRTMVLSLDFNKGSAALSPTMKEKIDTFIPKLHKLYQDGKVIRIEGFSDSGGGSSAEVSLAMKRALAVESHIREVSAEILGLYIVGFANQNTSLQLNAISSCAEIAAYDNVLNLDNVDIQTISSR